MSSFYGDHDPPDLLAASHRGLHRHLIPTWLQTPKLLSENIENSAYGETPSEIIGSVFDRLDLQPKELLVDLGCGGGNVLHAALVRGARALGIERNPELFRAAQQALKTWPDNVLSLLCQDFLQTDCEWGHADIAYATTARFTPKVLRRLAGRLCDPSSRIRAVACLGRPFALSEGWSQNDPLLVQIMWNPGERLLEERLYVYRRIAQAPSLDR